ncbi:MAG: signal transduction histidine-protein kinase BaeS [Candidatus Accumulibacter adjunctus]|uniref:Signal transduction histidine-protein kinase BaeS n=1 Tax=Candidatus Accumulibacter adjunctus TaxID=1454001 RepID=A0A011PDB5_9PROT|nr:MAG: signal transduction histidine-protein kinase BaeS [Candidatus Accumulibacter adjunctus]
MPNRHDVLAGDRRHRCKGRIATILFRQERQVDKLSSRLRIGEKIGLGFALVGVLLTGVIWHYHQTLRSVIDDYQQLQRVFEVRKSLAVGIEIEMAAARDAEKSFLLLHQERFAADVDRHLQAMREKVSALGAVDEESQRTAEQLQALMDVYQQRFAAVAEAWRAMGLDENSGIQGAFRQKIHRLHELSAQYNVDRLLTVLLQIRRNEKDLALRQDVAYRDRVRRLLREFRQLVDTSELPEVTRQKLLAEVAAYAKGFESYASSALKPGYDGAGRGPFRDAAQRIEAILHAHYVPNLETNILKLRRREKDFLLRGDESYPPMVVEIARAIRVQIGESALAESDRAQLLALLRDYQRGFLVLVSQRAHIAALTAEMNAAADQVAPLIEANVAQANETMVRRAREIDEDAQARVRLDLIVAASTLLLAALLALGITIRIVRPVRRMAGILDDLAYGTPTERVPTVPGGRNEINAMGESLNALLDHRATFLGWWKASMDELIARRALLASSGDEERDETLTELRAASIVKVHKLNAIRGRLLQHAHGMVEVGRRLCAAGSLPTGDAKKLEHAAQAMESLLDVLAVEEATPDAAANSVAATTDDGNPRGVGA